MKTRKAELYRGTYKGVSFEINNFNRPGMAPYDDCWTFYLILHVLRCPEDLRNELWLEGKVDDKGCVHYDYMAGLVADIEWHCGITYYAKTSGFDGGNQTIKAGCDYQHYWDEGCRYSLESVLYDVKKAIKSLYELFPNYKCYCQGHGGLYLSSEGTFNDSGEFYSNEWTDKKHD